MGNGKWIPETSKGFLNNEYTQNSIYFLNIVVIFFSLKVQNLNGTNISFNQL